MPLAHNYQAWLNARGGIDGHPLKIIIMDDQGSATTALQDVKQLVEQDHVNAIAGEDSLDSGTWAPFLSSKGIPCVGCAMYELPNTSDPLFFPVGDSNLSYFASVAFSKQLGIKKMATFYCNVSGCSIVPTALTKAAQLLGGIKLVASLAVSPSQPSFAAPCLSEKNSGARSDYIGAGSSPTQVALVNACTQEGDSPIHFTAGGFGYHNASAPGAEGLRDITSVAPLADDQSVYGRDLHQVLGSTINDPSINAVATMSFAGLMMFTKAAELANLQPGYTPADLLAGIYKIKDETLDGGLPAGITYTKGQITHPLCVWATPIVNHQWDAAKRTTYCVPLATWQKIYPLFGEK
jgi:branched-chain amino acid transport system substrate-binding protein